MLEIAVFDIFAPAYRQVVTITIVSYSYQSIVKRMNKSDKCQYAVCEAELSNDEILERAKSSQLNAVFSFPITSARSDSLN